jgi:acetyl-CoA synthetase
LERANLTRLYGLLDVAGYHELQRASVDEPDRFWSAVVEDLGLGLQWDEVVDLSRGPKWARWFIGATTNIAQVCVHRRRELGGEALVGRYEDGTRESVSWADFSRQVTQVAEALVELGVEPGDRVGIFLPMSPDVAIASNAIAHVGAIQVPIFSGFAAPAVAQRLDASEAKVVITQHESSRRGRVVPMLAILEEAMSIANSTAAVVLAPYDLDMLLDEPFGQQMLVDRHRASRPVESASEADAD